MTYRERLGEIVNLSYKILSHKIAVGSIKVYNEASMQLHLGVILRQLGTLYEFAEKDNFRIELEKTIILKNQTAKSSNGKARCDIWLELGNEYQKAFAVIELKYFKYSQDTEATTDNRFSLMLDIGNLEDYAKIYPNLLGYAMVYTNNENYTKDGTSTHSAIKLAPYITQSIKRRLTKKGKQVDIEVKLQHQYIANWVKFSSSSEGDTGHYFLKIDLDRYQEE